MSNFRVSKTTEEYIENLKDFSNLLGEFSEVEVKISEYEYSSFIYAKGNENSVEVMEADCGVWVEFFRLDIDEAAKEGEYLSYEEALIHVKQWIISK